MHPTSLMEAIGAMASNPKSKMPSSKFQTPLGYLLLSVAPVV
jgi:hypothetical protein